MSPNAGAVQPIHPAPLHVRRVYCHMHMVYCAYVVNTKTHYFYLFALNSQLLRTQLSLKGVKMRTHI